MNRFLIEGKNKFNTLSRRFIDVTGHKPDILETSSKLDDATRQQPINTKKNLLQRSKCMFCGQCPDISPDEMLSRELKTAGHARNL